MTNNSAYIFQGLLKRGFNPAQAAALAGNAEQESGFDPTRVNGPEGAYGLLQWRQDRLSGLQNYAASIGQSPTDPDVQMNWIVKEMKGPEAKNAAAFLRADTIPAANAAVKSYIRYGDNTEPVRLKYAMQFAGQPAGQPAVSSVPQYDAAGNPIAATSAPPAQPQPLVTSSPARGNTVPLAPSDDDLISKYLAPSAAPATAPNPNAEPATGDRASELRAATDPNSDDALLAKYLGTSPAAPATNASSSSPSVADVAAGDRAAELRSATASAQPPELFPGSSAFQNAVVNNMLGIGPLVNGAIDTVGGDIANFLTGGRVTPAQAVATAHAQEDQQAAAHPIANAAGAVVGSVLPFTAVGPTGLASKLLGTAGSYGTGAVGDMALRGLAGAGSSAALSGADTAERGGDAQQVLHNMLTAGVIGGVAAPVVHAIGSLIGKGIEAFSGPSAPKMLANALTADQNAPDAVNQLLQNHGPAATVADLGHNTRAQAAGLASLPGEAGSIVVNNLTQRAAGAGTRLADDVAGTIGAGQPIGALTDNIVAQQKAAAAPLYDAIRGVPVQVTPEIQALTQRPAIQSALKRARTMMQNDGIQPSSTVQLYDFAKQALDDQASAAVRKGDNNAARQFTNLSNQLRSAIDAQVPAYAAARDAFAGPAKVLDAVEAGQKVFSSATSPEDVQGAMATMSPSEKDGYLAGAQAAVQKMIGTARTDAQGVKNAFQSSYAKEKLAALVGKQQADRIAAALDREAGYAATSSKAYNNSITSANQAQQRLLNPQLAGVSKLPPQTWQGLLLAGIGKARSAITAIYRDAQNKELANMLTGGALSPEHSAAVAKAGAPGSGLIPGAAVAIGAQNNGVEDNPLLSGVLGRPDMVFRNGRWIPRIYVRGGTPIQAQ